MFFSIVFLKLIFTLDQNATSEILAVFTLIRQANLEDGEGSGTPLQYSCLETPMDGGTW